MTEADVLTAFAGDAWESQILPTLERAPGLTVARRCVDLADLLAAAAAGHGTVALVSGALRRLNRDAVAQLAESGTAVVGVGGPGADGAGDEADEARLRALGIAHVVRGDAEIDEIVSAIAAANTGQADVSVAELRRIVEGEQTGSATGESDDGPEPARSEPGSVVAIWGPCGSPGRTTLAVNLAAECAALSGSTMLADVDTYAASVAQTLGILDEAPGMAAVARAANAGRLDVVQVARSAREVSPGFRVLTGLTRSARWTELSPAALSTVWEVCRSVAAITVVDVGFCLEQDEELMYDTIAPQRNGATLATLADADTVIVVGSADPVGIGRLVRGIGELVEVVPRVTVDVVVNRVRRTVTPGDPEDQIGAALERFAGLRNVTYLPDDPRSVDAALAEGLTLAESAPGTPLRQTIQQLAARHLRLDPLAADRRGRRGGGRRLGLRDRIGRGVSRRSLSLHA